MEWLSSIAKIVPSLFKWVNKWRKQPQPVFEFEYNLEKGALENSYCHYRYDNATGAHGWFLRLAVNNLGRMPIRNANVRVEKIDRVFPEEKVEVGGTPFFLHWANENTNNSRMIYQNTPVFIDVVHTLAGRDQMYIFAKPKHAGAGIRTALPPGEYVLTLRLLSEDIAPVECLVFIRHQSWSNPYMELVN